MGGHFYGSCMSSHDNPRLIYVHGKSKNSFIVIQTDQHLTGLSVQVVLLEALQRNSPPGL